MWYIAPHVRVRTCEACVVCDVFTRVGDTCAVFVSAVARVNYLVQRCMTSVCVDDAK